MTASADAGAGPLEGLVVVDMSQMLAAPMCAMMLADYGATVVKVEPPTGDVSRKVGWDVNGTSAWWRLYGRNKHAVTLDLKRPRALALMRRMLDGADVLIENMRPGKLEALGLAPERLHETNPGLVVLRVTGWGQTGPYAERGAFGTQAEAMTGFAFGNGPGDGPPTLPSFPLADAAAGYLGAYAVMAAVWRRDRDPERRGQVIDLSLCEALFGLLGPQATAYDRLGIVMTREGNRSPVSIPRGIYPTRDGHWVAISCATEAVVERTFAAMGRPELYRDPRFAARAARREHVEQVDALMAEWTRLHDRDDIVARLAAAGAAVSPVNSIKEVLEDPHFTAREMVVAAPSEDAGPLKMQNVFPRFSRTPGRVRWTGRPLGADNEAWFVERLGLSRAEFEELRRERAM